MVIGVAVLVAHPLLRSGLERTLGRVPEVSLRPEAADVALVELRQLERLTAQGRDRLRADGLKVLAISLDQRPDDVATAHRLGASGLLGARDGPNRLLEAIRAIHRGGCAWPAARRSTGQCQPRPGSQANEDDGGTPATLT